MAASQLNLFGGEPAEGPEGLAFRRDFISPGEEADLAAHMGALPFAPFEFHGFEGKRRTLSFGLQYRFDGSGLHQAEPFPDWLLPCRDRAAAWAGWPRDAVRHALLVEYAPGAGIGWHRDRSVFGEVVGISLLAPARLRFRRKAGDKWERDAVLAEPRSAYLLRGPAREEWEHSIAPMDRLRYSITFRTLRSDAQL
jgi:alkylated DNA repair dioxygenase AlkB